MFRLFVFLLALHQLTFVTSVPIQNEEHSRNIIVEPCSINLRTLNCTGRAVTEDSLNKIDQRLRQTELKKDDLKEIDTLVLKDTSIVNLNTELFCLTFSLEKII